MESQILHSSERAFVGTKSMLIEGGGESVLSGLSNLVDLNQHAGNYIFSAQISTDGLATDSALILLLYFNEDRQQVGDGVVLASIRCNKPAWTLYSAAIKRSAFPTGARYAAVQFGLVGASGMVFGRMFVDAVQLTGGNKVLPFTPAVLTESSTLDDLKDGADYRRVSAKAISADSRILASGVEGLGALATLNTVGASRLSSDSRSLEKVTGGGLVATGQKLVAQTGWSLHLEEGESPVVNPAGKLPSAKEARPGEVIWIESGTDAGHWVISSKGLDAVRGDGFTKKLV